MVVTMNEPPFDLHAYDPPLSLWKLVEQQVPDHEREEVKSMLGESLVDQSLELHEEIDTLLEIWRDYRDETNQNSPQSSKLPEPPGVRDRLIQEIQFFVENVQEKAKRQGVNPDKILSRHNTQVIDYALESSRPGTARGSSRPSTARSHDGRETPMMCTPTSSDRTSGVSTLSEEIESMNDKLNFLKFDEVTQHLRETLEEETSQLLRDISFLQQCLDEEATFRAESQGIISTEPTITELREERSTLEKDLLSREMVNQTSPVNKPPFETHVKKLVPLLPAKPKAVNSGDAGQAALIKPRPLKPNHPRHSVVQHLPKSEDTSGHVKPGPIKASHHIKFTAKDDSSLSENIQSSVQLPTGASSGHQSPEGLTNIRRRTISPSRANIVTVMHEPSKLDVQANNTQIGNLVPSPPSSIKPQNSRPGSAERFRRMVAHYRDSS